MRPFRAKYSKSMGWLCVGLMLSTGCSQVREFKFTNTWENARSYHTSVATKIEYPAVNSCLNPEVAQVARPHALDNPADIPARDIGLHEAIRMALNNSDILRSLGGSVVSGAAGARTKLDPALNESNPGASVEAALSAFDAQLGGQLFWNATTQPPTNPLIALQGTRTRGSTFAANLSKRSGTGATFTARTGTNRFEFLGPVPNPLPYSGFVEGEYRQPLALGAGVKYNQIAGPNGGIGNYNGVLIARINNDVALTDFEAGVISFINDVETAYWELYFAYHNLEAQVAGRQSSLLTWQRIKELQNVGARGGDAAAEAQARSQYYSFDVQVTEALTGPTGIYDREQQLRYLVGLPPTDGLLLKPITKPMEGEVVYDWDSSLADALTKRVEIRRQKWTIKRRELEHIAAKLNKRPTVDFLGRYRLLGGGRALIDGQDANDQLASVAQNLLTGDNQQWQAGVEFSYPVGFRRASLAITNARWQLAKERAVLEEQELRISHDLSDASRQVTRAYALTQANFKRQASDRDRVSALQARYESGLDNINFLLQAQQSLATSQSAYYRSLVDYQLAMRDFQREKGALLNYNQIGLSEGAWPSAAYQDARERGRLFAPRNRPEAVDVPNPVSRGSFAPGQVGAGGGVPVGTTAILESPLQEAILGESFESTTESGDVVPAPTEEAGEPENLVEDE